MTFQDDSSPTAGAVIVYFIRHGESTANLHPEIISGRDPEALLTEKGTQQARETGKFLRREGIAPIHFYTSPLKRAQQTSKLITEAGACTTVPCSVDNRLAEISQGVAEQMRRSDIYTDAVRLSIAQRKKEFKFQDGESMMDGAHRIEEWVNSIKKTIPAPENGEVTYVIAISHAMVIRSYVSYLQDLTVQQTYESEFYNCAITSVDITRTPTLLRFNDYAHLDTLLH